MVQIPCFVLMLAIDEFMVVLVVVHGGDFNTQSGREQTDNIESVAQNCAGIHPKLETPCEDTRMRWPLPFFQGLSYYSVFPDFYTSEEWHIGGTVKGMALLR